MAFPISLVMASSILGLRNLFWGCIFRLHCSGLWVHKAMACFFLGIWSGEVNYFILKYARPYDGVEMHYFQTHLRLYKIFHVH